MPRAIEQTAPLHPAARAPAPYPSAKDRSPRPEDFRDLIAEADALALARWQAERDALADEVQTQLVQALDLPGAAATPTPRSQS